MLVLCDFDGTITTQDVTNLLWDRYGLPDWRGRLLPPYRAGERTTLELMDEGWRAIDRGQDELLRVARLEIGLREGFIEFVALCDRENWALHVVSCGIDWYLRAFLPAGVHFTSYRAELEDGWRVRLPDGCALPDGADFKVHVFREIQATRGHETTVFVGDGRNDFPIAKACDHVFALAGSTLLRLCREAGIPVTEFEAFHTVAASLLEISGRASRPATA
jgi:2-hydroxy-3-keto-5-methylthiopentenyl-1-phosphate phosphatase